MKLKDIVKEFRSGVVRSRMKRSSESTAQYKYRVITVKSLNDNCLLDHTLFNEIYTDEAIPSRYITKPQSIVMRNSYPFTASIIEDDTSGTVVPSNLFILSSISETILPEYLCIFLNSKDARRHIAMFTSQSTIAIISIKPIGEIDINIPSLETQQRIVNIVKTYRLEMGLLEQLIEEKSKLHNYTVETLLSNKERI